METPSSIFRTTQNGRPGPMVVKISDQRPFAAKRVHEPFGRPSWSDRRRLWSIGRIDFGAWSYAHLLICPVLVARKITAYFEGGMGGGSRDDQKLILLLDDDVQFRALLAAVLSARGCRVLEAGSGEAATLLLDDENPDLLIVDGLLPDLSGAEWIESVRQRDADTTIVFLSAYWRDLETFQRLTEELSVSMVAYKPIEPLAFAEAIVELLDSTSKPADSIRPAPSNPPPEPTDTLRARMARLRDEYTKNLPHRPDEARSAD